MRITRDIIWAKLTDGYKPSHWMFYEDGIREMYDYMESRGGVFADMTFFGLQALLKKYFLGNIITRYEVRRCRKFFKSYYGMEGIFNAEGWNGIADLGYLPLEMWAVPEGTKTPVRTPQVVYWNTDPRFPWLPGYIEPLAFKVWNPSTVCTLSQHCKAVLHQGLMETGSPELLPYMLHDFGYRGVSSEESAEFAGAAHLVNFRGTDTLPAIDFINRYYSDGVADEDGDPVYMPGCSVRATEHSVMTHRGRKLEVETVREILRKCPTGIIAMVGDSYDIFRFAGEILGGDLHTEVVEREGLVVVRPDSGEPIPTMLKLLWILGEKFGWYNNTKSYRTLNHVRTLQGDKNDYNAIYDMIRAIKGAGWSLDNIATFGMGGALLQGSTRDTQQMAVKLSSLTDADGNWRDVSKDPITDPGKYSKAGRFAVVGYLNVKGHMRYRTVTLKQGEALPLGNILRPVFRNGKLLVDEPFETIRARADQWMFEM